MGITLVHEAGHYFGLAHTFNSNTCVGDNDGISDTPIEKSPAAGCPVGRDSCTGHAGNDPVRNFMDYSDDSCMTDGFTAMQMDMMREQVTEYRPALLTRTDNEEGGPTDCNAAGLFANFRVEILADQFPADISWRLIKGSDIVAEGDMFRDVAPFVTRTWTENKLCVGNYEFRISDSFADGLCCSAGQGEYRVFVNGQQIAKAGDFGAEDKVQFTIGGDDLAPLVTSPEQTPTQPTPPVTASSGGNSGSQPAPAPPTAPSPQPATEPGGGTGNTGGNQSNNDNNNSPPPPPPPSSHPGVTGCALLNVRILTDDFPEETSWAVFPDGSTTELAGGKPGDANATRIDSNGLPLAQQFSGQSPGGVADRNVRFEWKSCLSEAHKYKWILRDSYGDGVCCNNGAGSFQVRVNNNVIVDGDGVFDDQFIHFFDVFPGDISSISGGSGGDDDVAQDEPSQPSFSPDAASPSTPSLPLPPSQQEEGGEGGCAPLTVRVHTDDFPEESSWKLFFDGGSNAIAEGAASGDDTSAKRFDSNGGEITTPGGGAADRNIVFEWSTCLTEPGSYAWTLDDAWGDGICCSSTYERKRERHPHPQTHACTCWYT